MTCELPRDLGVFTAGEKPAPLRYTFTDYDGNVIDLSGYTVRFVWSAAGAGVVGTTGNGTLADAANGVVEYTWSGAEFATPGPYVGQFWVGNLTNRWASIKIKWTVQAGTGAVPAI